MADGRVDIKEDASPTKFLASQTHLHGADTVHAEEVVIVDAAGNIVGATSNRLNVDGSGVTQPVSDGGGAITVDALNLDIRDLVAASDEVGARLRDAAGSAFGTAANPVRVKGSNSSTDGDTFTPNTSDGYAIMGAREDTGPSTLAEDDVGILRATQARALHVNLRGDTGTEVGTSGAPVRVDPTGTTTQPVSNTVLSVVGGGAEATAQRVTIANDSTGVVSVDDNGAALTVDQATAANLNAQVVGDVASGAADGGNPVKIGVQARTTNPTAVTNGQRVNVIGDKVGRQVVRLGQIRDLTVDNNVTITDAAETTILAAGAANVFRDMTALIIANTSVTGVRVDIRDASGGTIRMSLYCPATQTVGAVLTRPKNQTTSANAWTAQSSSAVTDLRVYIQAEENI